VGNRGNEESNPDTQVQLSSGAAATSLSPSPCPRLSPGLPRAGVTLMDASTAVLSAAVSLLVLSGPPA